MPKLRDLLRRICGSKQERENVVSEKKESVVHRKRHDFVFREDEPLESIIVRLENDIANGHWIDTLYGTIDLKMMPALVDQANKKYPEMKLQFAVTPEDIPTFVKNTIDGGIQSSRMIVNLDDNQVHFAVIDHKTVNDQISLLLFEPVAFKHMPPTMLAMRAKIALEESQLPNCHFSMVELDIQRSASECAIFSLSLAKKLYREFGKLERLHKDNIEGLLCNPDGFFVDPDQVDRYLPVNFYKHTQGINRLNKYIESNPRAKKEMINKKGERIYERFNKNLVVIDGKNVSVSSHQKRIREFKSLIR
ncbi:YopJ/AvrA family T3SS effector serine/threonine acetyltransferase [Bartonella harrusi]|uniref:YopJ/AvrA family T3SS effector serine/threonine acetyltransferase n=1 Tax=Bartonella harrusi TaxID=2961895 RepID=A0ABY5ERG4_9HYPH|nr:YopJ/AvrA family T3SS effector serine/threonine acetyltransferase [Bartonella harrusi]UTO27847.1 YopJ/AvrA family T3SS effector serine/threonine acetyltransferase [Bartonella harrusi]